MHRPSFGRYDSPNRPTMYANRLVSPVVKREECVPEASQEDVRDTSSPSDEYRSYQTQQQSQDPNLSRSRSITHGQAEQARRQKESSTFDQLNRLCSTSPLCQVLDARQIRGAINPPSNNSCNVKRTKKALLTFVLTSIAYRSRYMLKRMISFRDSILDEYFSQNMPSYDPKLRMELAAQKLGVREVLCSNHCRSCKRLRGLSTLRSSNNTSHTTGLQQPPRPTESASTVAVAAPSPRIAHPVIVTSGPTPPTPSLPVADSVSRCQPTPVAPSIDDCFAAPLPLPSLFDEFIASELALPTCSDNTEAVPRDLDRVPVDQHNVHSEESEELDQLWGAPSQRKRFSSFSQELAADLGFHDFSLPSLYDDPNDMCSLMPQFDEFLQSYNDPLFA